MTAIVLLPGLDGTTLLLSELAVVLRRSFDTVIVVAYPPREVLGYAELELIARKALPTDKPFVILGESFSGPIALSIAANPPPGLAGLILVATFAKSPVSMLRPFASLLRFAPVRSLPMFALSWWLLGRWATPQLETVLRASLDSVGVPVLRNRAVASLRVDVTHCLEKIAVPVLYLRATRDRLLNSGAATRILAHIPHGMQIDILGPHLLLQTRSEACIRGIVDFISTNVIS